MTYSHPWTLLGATVAQSDSRVLIWEPSLPSMRILLDQQAIILLGNHLCPMHGCLTRYTHSYTPHWIFLLPTTLAMVIDPIA